MSSRTIRLTTAGIAAAGAILSIGDKLYSMPGIPGWLTSSWPVVMVSATIFNAVAHALLVPETPFPTQPPKTP